MRIVLCDDHLLFLEGMRSVLTAHGHDVVAVVDTPAGALAEVAAHRPDVCILDMGFPQGSGLDAAREMTRSHPDTKVLILSATDDPGEVAHVLEAGINGFLRKDQKIDAVLSALDRIADGQVAIDADLLRRAVSHRTVVGSNTTAGRLRHLTDREREVLRLIVRGDTSSQIASTLGISTSTARTHVQNVLVKLQVHSRLQAAALVAQLPDTTW
jgi:two-component system nitrate/nitrite response regulator NarL